MQTKKQFALFSEMGRKYEMKKRLGLQEVDGNRQERESPSRGSAQYLELGAAGLGTKVLGSPRKGGGAWRP